MNGEGSTTDAALVALGASGGFLLAGLLLGIWKYRRMLTDASHRAPVYVDVAHRAGLGRKVARLRPLGVVKG